MTDEPKKVRPQNKHLRPPWKKGQSGNPSGPKPGYRHNSIGGLIRKMNDESNGEIKRGLAKIAVTKALKGDKDFWDKIEEKLDGRKNGSFSAQEVTIVVHDIIIETIAICSDYLNKDQMEELAQKLSRIDRITEVKALTRGGDG